MSQLPPGVLSDQNTKGSSHGGGADMAAVLVATKGSLSRWRWVVRGAG